jgi:hypothetical protein
MPINPELLAIARCGAGVNNIPVEKCAEEGVVVFITPGANANAVKELALCALLLLPCLLGCSKQIEDTNGEDTALVSLTYEDILNKAVSHNAVGMVRSQLGGKQTLRVNKLSGVYAFNSHAADGGTLTVTLSTTLHAGNLRAVVMCEGEYVQDIPLGENQTVTVENASGKYQVRLGAESAKLDATLTFEEK